MDHVEVGRLILYIASQKVFVDEKRVRVIGKQWKFLEALALCMGGMVTREYLLAYLHPDPKCRPKMRSIDLQASKLRKKLAAQLGGANYVHSTRGEGYRLHAPL